MVSNLLQLFMFIQLWEMVKQCNSGTVPASCIGAEVNRASSRKEKMDNWNLGEQTEIQEDDLELVCLSFTSCSLDHVGSIVLSINTDVQSLAQNLQQVQEETAGVGRAEGPKAASEQRRAHISGNVPKQQYYLIPYQCTGDPLQGAHNWYKME